METWRQDYKVAQSGLQGGRPKARPQCGETMVEPPRDSWSCSGRKLHLHVQMAGSGPQMLPWGVQRNGGLLTGGRPGDSWGIEINCSPTPHHLPRIFRLFWTILDYNNLDRIFWTENCSLRPGPLLLSQKLRRDLWYGTKPQQVIASGSLTSVNDWTLYPKVG